MKKIVISMMMLGYSLVMANDTNSSLLKKQIEEQMKKEQKYAKEQKFYNSDEYDFKGAEVNEKSLSKIKAPEPEYDFDMDHVYD